VRLQAKLQEFLPTGSIPSMPASDYTVVDSVKQGNLELVISKKAMEHKEDLYSFCIYRITARGDRTSWHHKMGISDLRTLLDEAEKRLPNT